MRISYWSSDVGSSDLLADRVGALLPLVLHEQVGSLVAEDQRNHRAGGPLERCQIGPHVDAIDQEDGEAAEQDRQDEAAEDDRDRQILRPDAGLGQLLLHILDLFFLQNLQLAQDGAHPVGGFILADQSRAALRGRGGDAGLELFAAVVERFDALRSEEHTSELQSLIRISYAVFCLKKK